MIHNYRLPITGFTIKPAALKSKTVNTSNKKSGRILYCVAIKTEEGWKAEVNTKGLEGYENKTILDFTEQSFELKNRRNVFLHEKDKTGHWVRIMRDNIRANIAPGSSDIYCTLCEDRCFSGRIVKVNGVSKFDILEYKGNKNECYILLNKNYKKDDGDN